MDEDILEMLKKMPLFEKVSPRVLWRVAGIAQIKDYKTDDVLLIEGKEAMGCFLILEGEVGIFKHLNDPAETQVAAVGEGEIVGELSVIDGLPHSASAKALTAVHCLYISPWDFKEQMQAYPELAVQLLPVVTIRLRKMLEALSK